MNWMSNKEEENVIAHYNKNNEVYDKLLKELIKVRKLA